MKYSFFVLEDYLGGRGVKRGKLSEKTVDGRQWTGRENGKRKMDDTDAMDWCGGELGVG